MGEASLDEVDGSRVVVSGTAINSNDESSHTVRIEIECSSYGP